MKTTKHKAVLNVWTIKCWIFPIVFLAVLTIGQDASEAQHSSLYAHRNQIGQPIPLTVDRGSLYFSQTPEVRALKKHDIIHVRVDELARVSSDGSSERRKNMNIDAILNDWVRLNGFRKLEKDQQSGGDPQIKGSLAETIRNEASAESTQRLTENIATKIVDIRPNGNLVILGHKKVSINNEVWLMQITGICRQQDIDRTNNIESKKIIDLHIVKKTKGSVRDGVRRGWLKKFYDRVSPF